jgi:hypothetical protein
VVVDRYSSFRSCEMTCCRTSSHTSSGYQRNPERANSLRFSSRSPSLRSVCRSSCLYFLRYLRLCLLKSPFLLRQLMLQPMMNTLLVDVGAPLAPPDPANMDAVARRSNSRSSRYGMGAAQPAAPSRHGRVVSHHSVEARSGQGMCATGVN